MTNSQENEISELIARIKHHGDELNTKGLWLFLTTLACWSVDEGIQIIPMTCTVGLFTYYLVILFRKKGKGTFREQLQQIQQKFPNQLSIEKIKHLETQHLSEYVLFKTSLEFFIGYTFSIFSLLHFLSVSPKVTIPFYIGIWVYYTYRWWRSYNKYKAKTSQTNIE